MSMRQNGSSYILVFQLRSRLLRSCSYDPRSQMMALRMRTGAVKVWSGVPEALVRSLVEDNAPGFHYSTVIKHYLGEPLSPLRLAGMWFRWRLRTDGHRSRFSSNRGLWTQGYASAADPAE